MDNFEIGVSSQAQNSPLFCSFWYNPNFISKQSHDLRFKGESDTLFLSPGSISTHQYVEIADIGSVCMESYISQAPFQQWKGYFGDFVNHKMKKGRPGK
jgi:hypothetical protein